MLRAFFAAQRDVSFATISRAPSPKIDAFKKRRGWKFNWVSSNANASTATMAYVSRKKELTKENIYNFGSSGFPSEEAPRISVFYEKGEDIFHAYSAYARGSETVINTYN